MKRVFGVYGLEYPDCCKRMHLRTVVEGSPAALTITTSLLRSTGPPLRPGGGDDRTPAGVAEQTARALRAYRPTRPVVCAARPPEPAAKAGVRRGLRGSVGGAGRWSCAPTSLFPSGRPVFRASRPCGAGPRGCTVSECACLHAVHPPFFYEATGCVKQNFRIFLPLVPVRAWPGLRLRGRARCPRFEVQYSRTDAEKSA